MGLLKSLFGSKPDANRPPPEVEAIFKKMEKFLNDESLQLDILPDAVQLKIRMGKDCDELPDASGEFGRTITNPIPVNGPIGEAIYLSSLVTLDGQPILFHRLGSHADIDIYETLSADGKQWDVLFFSFYHPRKSHKSPQGYKISKDRLANLNGTNRRIADFPKGLKRAVFDFCKSAGMIPMMPKAAALQASENGTHKRPANHLSKIEQLKKEKIHWVDPE